MTTEEENGSGDKQDITRFRLIQMPTDIDWYTDTQPKDTSGRVEKVKTFVKKSARDCWSFQTLKNTFPIISWLPKYRLYDLQCDIIAGVTVGLTVIPQGLAYGRVANLPPQYGLYSAFIGVFVYIFLGTAKDITLGPTALMSLMTAAFAKAPVENDPSYAILLCLFSGIVQFILGILHLGSLVSFISYPVINGFTSAAAITIAFGQLKDIFGLKHIPREFLEMVYETFHKLPQTNIWDMVMGFVCFIILMLMKKMKEIKWKDDDDVPLVKRILRKIIWLIGTARNAVLVLISGILAGILLKFNVDKLSLTGHLKSGLPSLTVPSFTFENGNVTRTTGEVFGDIGAGFAIVPLLGILENIAIGKAFARKNKYKLDASQEMIAIGVGNLASCFVGAYPVTGSFSRTAVNSQTGVRTPLGGLFTGQSLIIQQLTVASFMTFMIEMIMFTIVQCALVLLALGVLTPWFYYIPKAALAAVIIAAVIHMIDYKIVKVLWKVNKIDLVPLFVTFVTSFLIGIEYGILIGVGVSLLILLYPIAKPKLKTKEDSNTLNLFIDSGLSFPAAEYIQQCIEDQINDSSATVVLLDCSQITDVDFTSIQALEQLQEGADAQSKVLVFENLKPSIKKLMKRKEMRNLNQVDEAGEPGIVTNGKDKENFSDIELVEVGDGQASVSLQL